MKLEKKYFSPGLIVVIGVATVISGSRLEDKFLKFVFIVVGVLEIMFGLQKIQEIRDAEKKIKDDENKIFEGIIDIVNKAKSEIEKEPKKETKETKKEVKKEPKKVVKVSKPKSAKVKDYKIKDLKAK